MKKVSLILSLFIVAASTGFGKVNNGEKSAEGNHASFHASQTVKPVNGVLKGIVELGATGFNFFVIKMDAQKNWELVKAEYGLSKAYEEKTDPAYVFTVLKEYINKDMFGKYKVKSKNIHFIVSSGADRTIVVQKIVMELNKKGYVVNHVTAEEEAQYGLAATLPKDQYGSAFVVDMGSSNTKIAYYETGKTDVTGKETVGSKYAEKNKTDEAAYKDAFSVANTIPAANRKKCYIIGGVPFMLANSHRQGDEKYTTLKDPSGYEYDKIGKDDKDKIKLKSGLNIYKAIADATKCPEFIFPWDSDFAIGFLLLKTN